MAGFPSFFEKRSRISSSSAQTLVPQKTSDSETELPIAHATTATYTPLKINKVVLAGVAGSDEHVALENSPDRNKYLGTATAKPATREMHAVAVVASVADPTTYEPVYRKGQERPVLTLEQLMAIPLRNCLSCFRFEIPNACCTFYDAVMPEPARPCRCRHYRLRGTSGDGDPG